jgi:hypothetical protein
MTLNEAFSQFINSPEFKEIARSQDSRGKKYRVYAGRFNKGELGAGAIVEILIANGYEVKANKAKKKISK